MLFRSQTTVTLDAVPIYAWTVGSNLTVVKAIQCVQRFLPFHAGKGLTDKDWGDLWLSFRYCDLDFLSVGWASDMYPLTPAANPVQERVNNADGTVASVPVTLGKWGPSPWAQAVWGRQTRNVLVKSTLPTDFNYSAQLTLTLGLPCALSRFELQALDMKIDGTSEKVAR